MPEAIVNALSTWDYTRLLIVVALAAIIGPPTTIYLLRRRNGQSHPKPDAREHRLDALEKWRGESDDVRLKGFQRLSGLEADVASLKDEFERTTTRLEQRIERAHAETRQEVKELAKNLASAVAEQATSITGEFRLLRRQLVEKKVEP